MSDPKPPCEPLAWNWELNQPVNPETETVIEYETWLDDVQPTPGEIESWGNGEGE